MRKSMAAIVLIFVLLAGGCSSGSGSSPQSGVSSTTEDPSYAASKRRNDLVAAFSKEYGSQEELNKRAIEADFDLSQEGLTPDILRANLFPEDCPPAYVPRPGYVNLPCEPFRTPAQQERDFMRCRTYWAAVDAKQTQLSAGELLPFSERSGVISDDGTNCLPYRDPNVMPDQRSTALEVTAEEKCKAFWDEISAKSSRGERLSFTDGTGYLAGPPAIDCNPYKPK